MPHVVNAQITRVLTQDGQPMAEVAVATDDAAHPDLIALFVKGAEGEVSMKAAFRQEAEYALDWYDNSLHQAYQEVMEDGKSKGEQALSMDILSYRSIQEQLEQVL